MGSNKSKSSLVKECKVIVQDLDAKSTRLAEDLYNLQTSTALLILALQNNDKHVQGNTSEVKDVALHLLRNLEDQIFKDMEQEFECIQNLFKFWTVESREINQKSCVTDCERFQMDKFLKDKNAKPLTQFAYNEIERMHKYNDQIQSDLKSKNDENKGLKDTIYSLEEQVEKITMLTSQLEKENQSLQESRKNITQENEELREKLQDSSQLEVMLKDKESILKQNYERETDQEKQLMITEHNAKISDLQQTLDTVTKDSRKKDNEIDSLKAEILHIQQKDAKSNELENHFEEAKRKLEAGKLSISLSLDQLKTELDKKLIEIKYFEEKIQKLEQDLIDAQKNMEKYKETNELLQTQKHCLTAKTSEIEKSLKVKEEQVRKLNDQITAVTKHMQELEHENTTMKQELCEFKRKRVLQVQLYYQRRGGLLTAIEDELKCLLKSKMDSDKLQLEFTTCTEQNEIKNELPLILLCISASRLGTDVANAIQGLNLSSKVSLVVFHHRDEHALPSQSSEQVLTGNEFRNISGIFDMAFLSEKGIYQCAMNEKSITQLVSFVTKEGTQATKQSKC